MIDTCFYASRFKLQEINKETNFPGILHEICCTLEAEVGTCKEQLVPPGLGIWEGRGWCPEAHFIKIDKRQPVNSILRAIFK
jgi:hypothetical protein